MELKVILLYIRTCMLYKRVGLTHSGYMYKEGGATCIMGGVYIFRILPEPMR